MGPTKTKKLVIVGCRLVPTTTTTDPQYATLQDERHPKRTPNRSATLQGHLAFLRDAHGLTYPSRTNGALPLGRIPTGSPPSLCGQQGITSFSWCFVTAGTRRYKKACGAGPQTNTTGTCYCYSCYSCYSWGGLTMKVPNLVQNLLACQKNTSHNRSTI